MIAELLVDYVQAVVMYANDIHCLWGAPDLVLMLTRELGQLRAVMAMTVACHPQSSFEIQVVSTVLCSELSWSTLAVDTLEMLVGRGLSG